MAFKKYSQTYLSTTHIKQPPALSSQFQFFPNNWKSIAYTCIKQPIFFIP